MNLLKTSVLNGIAVLVKTATMFILNKILAVYVGPSGYAAIGQFQNFIQMVTSFAGGAINTAVVKYTAEYGENPNEQQKIWRTSGTLVLTLSLVFSILIIIFKSQLSLLIFHNLNYENVFFWFAISLTFFNFNTLFLAILNGKKEILSLVIANISGSILSLLLTYILAKTLHLEGALIALAVYQAIAFLITSILCLKTYWFKTSYLLGKLQKEIVIKFGQFALMSLVSAICAPLSQILIRTYITTTIDESHAGYWEAVTRLSNGYLMLVTTTLSVYYLPKFSELTDAFLIKKEIYNSYKYILPVTIMGSLTIYIFKDFIITLLFTKAFSPMKELLIWQLIGDTLKIGGWILSFLMLSKAMYKLYILSEILFTFLIIVLTILFTDVLGFKGITLAYAVNYLLYWLFLSKFLFKKLG